MGTQLRAAIPRAIETIPTDGRLSEQSFGTILSDIAGLLCPPPKTAEQVAALIGCSVRKAEKCLAGKQKWSGDDIAALVAEVLRRHRMRNVKVVAR